MVIHDPNIGDNFAIVKVELVVDEIIPFGKVQITNRWRAAGKSLANKCDFNGKLVQIDAGYVDENWQRTQEFTFYFDLGENEE